MKILKTLIIGSGPAGYTAAIYAARADLNPVLYTGMEPGGQLTTTTEVDNFPGYPEGVDGPTMMVQLQQQAERFGTDVRIGFIDKVEFSEGKFDVYMNVDAKVADLTTIKKRLVDQIDNSVMFYDQILNIDDIAKPEKWYHIGPGNVTAGMVKKSISSEGIEIINSLDSLNNI